MTRLLAALLLLAGLVPSAADAADHRLSLTGNAIQGGFMIGRTEPGARVRLDDRIVTVAPDGLFVIGFRRLAEPVATLRAEFRDGTTETRRIEVEQRTYQISRITGIAPRFVEPPPELMKRLEREYFMVEASRSRYTDRRDFLQRFDWPVVGRITGVYGSQRFYNDQPRNPHWGLDIAGPVGTPVRAAAGGRVTLTEHLFFAGKTVMIDHGHGLHSNYIHLDRIDVKVGDDVRRGQVVGTIGLTGRTAGAHLHWGFSWYEIRLDPALWLVEKPGR